MNKLAKVVTTTAATLGLAAGAVLTAGPASATAHVGEDVKMYSLNQEATGSYYFGCRGNVTWDIGIWGTATFSAPCVRYAKKYQEMIDIVDAAGKRHRITQTVDWGNGNGKIDFQNW